MILSESRVPYLFESFTPISPTEIFKKTKNEKTEDVLRLSPLLSSDFPALTYCRRRPLSQSRCRRRMGEESSLSILVLRSLFLTVDGVDLLGLAMKQSRRVLLTAGVRRRRGERQAGRERAKEERKRGKRKRERDRGTRDAAGKGETDKSKTRVLVV